MQEFDRKALIFMAVVIVLGVACVAGLFLRGTIMTRWDEWRAEVHYKLSSPEDVVFIPQAAVDAAVQATMAVINASSGTNIEPVSSPTAVPTFIPTATPNPVPASAILDGVRYETQHGKWNYCAPTNLSMALSYWGWQGTRDDTGAVLKPYEKDKNVMMYEMVDFVKEETELMAIVRSGGSLQLLKTLISEGFPVVIEKGIFLEETSVDQQSWVGHYNLITGYDDRSQVFVVQDSYYSRDYRINYTQLEQEWRAFNFDFLVVYPLEESNHLFSILGDPYRDEMINRQFAVQIAVEDAARLDGIDRFYALFNQGTNLTQLWDYPGAAEAYDAAFAYYANLDPNQRPWRIMWYQTGPYFAYYYMGRHQDVINLATTTLDTAHEPFLEESYYWRAKSYAALGDLENAKRDLEKSLKYHPGFIPSMDLLAELEASN
jgi:uncharacterized protein YvpB